MTLGILDCQLSIYLAPEICARVALRSGSTESRSETPASTNSRAGTPGSALLDLDTAPPSHKSTSNSVGQQVRHVNGDSSRSSSIGVSDMTHPAPLAKSKPKTQPKAKLPVPSKLSNYEIERNKNIAENKLFLAQAEEALLKSMGIEIPLPLFPKQQPKEKRSRTKRSPVPMEQRRRGRSATQEKS